MKSISSLLSRNLRHLTVQVVRQIQNEFYANFPILKITNLQTKKFCCFFFFCTLFIAATLYFHNNYKFYKLCFIEPYSQPTGYSVMATRIRLVAYMQQKKKQTKSRVLWNYIVHTTFSPVFYFIVIAVVFRPVRFVRFSVNHLLYNK